VCAVDVSGSGTSAEDQTKSAMCKHIIFDPRFIWATNSPIFSTGDLCYGNSNVQRTEGWKEIKGALSKMKTMMRGLV
jgi:hypothetical protein